MFSELICKKGILSKNTFAFLSSAMIPTMGKISAMLKPSIILEKNRIKLSLITPNLS